MVVGDAEVTRPAPRLLAELLQRCVLSCLYVLKALPLAVDRDVYGGLGLTGGGGFFGRNSCDGAALGCVLFEVVRNMPVPLVAPEQALEVCAALGAVDWVWQL